MKRLLTSLAILTLVASSASAHVGYKIKMSAIYKETKKGSATFRNVFVSGHAHYPDGTTLIVMVRPEKAGYLPLNVRVTVSKQEFAAEMGPWREGFPAGKYIVEAWFDIDKQTDSVQTMLKQEEEFSKCIKEDPEYQARYKKENPERYELLMRQIAASGRCASSRQYGGCELNIGSIDDAAQSNEGDRAFIRDHCALAKDMLTDLMKTYVDHSNPAKDSNTNADSFLAWSTKFENDLGLLDNDIAEKTHGVVYNARKGTYDLLSQAVMALGELEVSIKSVLYGDIGMQLAELAKIEAVPAASMDKDAKRRRELIRRSLADVDSNRNEAAKRFVKCLGDALFGTRGLDPAPERLKSWTEEIKTEFNFQWSD